MITRGASHLCAGRCTRMPDPFRPSALVQRFQVCRFCGAQREAPALYPVSTLFPVPLQPTLYTVGSVGTRVEQVLEALVARRVQVLLDIRWTDERQRSPLCAETLRQAVESRGIAYRQRSELSCAPVLRQLREDGDGDAFAAAYLAALASQEDLLRRIAGWARDHPICLLSLEHNAALGHLGLLATRLAALGGLEVEHLTLW
ncbi:MAG TPA: DUF488 family protein [Ktedonobacterales bacterium]|nr:DUF488 family protein [Ktedonobacterales bacterium]